MSDENDSYQLLKNSKRLNDRKNVITIRGNMVFYFNRFLIREIGIGKQYFNIYFEETLQKIAFVFFNEEDSNEDCLKMTKYGLVSDSYFFRFYNIDAEKIAGRYIPHKGIVEGKDAYIIDLNKKAEYKDWIKYKE